MIIRNNFFFNFPQFDIDILISMITIIFLRYEERFQYIYAISHLKL